MLQPNSPPSPSKTSIYTCAPRLIIMVDTGLGVETLRYRIDCFHESCYRIIANKPIRTWGEDVEEGEPIRSSMPAPIVGALSSVPSIWNDMSEHVGQPRCVFVPVLPSTRSLVPLLYSLEFRRLIVLLIIVIQIPRKSPSSATVEPPSHGAISLHGISVSPPMGHREKYLPVEGRAKVQMPLQNRTLLWLMPLLPSLASVPLGPSSHNTPTIGPWCITRMGPHIPLVNP
jgi:hypothetical protein